MYKSLFPNINLPVEIQLKPHNFPLSICYAWPQLLEKYTTMSLNERNGDNVPLLVLRRNVYLSYDHEIEIVKNADKKTVELLYYEACNSVYLERLMVPFDTAILLSAINACIDPDFNDKKDDDKLLSTELKAYLPNVYHLNLECWRNSSKFQTIKHRFFTHYNLISETLNTMPIDARNLQIKYLNICMVSPLYGSAFFDGYIEKTSLLRNSSQKNWIYIAINRHYICLVDFTKYSCILNISLIDCSWKSTVYMNNGIKSSYADGSSSLFLHFYPDKYQYSSKLIQFISKQTPMIEALLNSCRILTNNAENFCNFNLPQDVYYLLDIKSEFFDQNCGIYRNKLDEIVAADFDADGNYSMQPKLKFLIGPSILNSDLANLADESQRLLKAGGDYLHLDVMDGRFVPNLTFGHPVVKCLRKSLPKPTFFDMHMMVAEPEKWVSPIADAGADLYTFHLEATDNPGSLIRRIKEAGMQVGVAVKPGTSIDGILKFGDMIDVALVMTVEPGFGGQSFMADMMPKVRLINVKQDSSRLNHNFHAPSFIIF
uniref:ribulose-phosphate 3-epimerase n=1 Tax=Romanomermis culicivorax TaxID=13658 RepID=A0A915IKY9_ROMCU